MAEAVEECKNLKLALAISKKCDELSPAQNREFDYRLRLALWSEFFGFKLPESYEMVEVDIEHWPQDMLELAWEVLNHFTTEKEQKQRQKAAVKLARRTQEAKERAQEQKKRLKADRQAEYRARKKNRIIIKCSTASP